MPRTGFSLISLATILVSTASAFAVDPAFDHPVPAPPPPPAKVAPNSAHVAVPVSASSQPTGHPNDTVAPSVPAHGVMPKSGLHVTSATSAYEGDEGNPPLSNPACATAPSCQPLCQTTCRPSCAPQCCGAQAACCAPNACCETPAANCCPQTSCGFSADPCSTGPLAGGQVNWLFLHREHPGSAPILRSDNGSTLLDAREFASTLQTGIEVSVWINLNSDVAVAGRYFWLEEGTDRKARTTPANGSLATNPGFDRPADTFDSVLHRSSLQSGEIGLQAYAGESANLGLAVRYIEFNERLRDRQIDLTTGDNLGYSQFATRNDLIGLQLNGSVSLFEYDSLRLSVWGNAGLYANQADSTTAARLPGVINYADDSTTGVAFVGEVGIDLTTKITDGLSLVYGYRALYLDGVALATDQIAQTTAIERPNAPQRTTIDRSGNALLHGFSMGIEWQY